MGCGGKDPSWLTNLNLGARHRGGRHLPGGSGIAGGHDSRRLDHERNGPLRGASSMNNSTRDHQPLSRTKLDCAVFQIEKEQAVEHEEKLVFTIVLVPVELPLEHAEPDRAVVHGAKRLVPPLFKTLISQFPGVNKLKGSEFHVGVN